MKVILLQDVAKLGRRHSIVTVADGRGMNQLIPKGLALPATPENLKKVHAKNELLSQHALASEARFQEAVAALKELTVTIEAEANKQGHLFESIKVEKIVAALALSNLVVDVHDIVIPTPIKAVGEHTLTLSHHNKTSPFIINVVAK